MHYVGLFLFFFFKKWCPRKRESDTPTGFSCVWIFQCQVYDTQETELFLLLQLHIRCYLPGAQGCFNALAQAENKRETDARTPRENTRVLPS